MPDCFDRYIDLAEDVDIVYALEKYSGSIGMYDKDTLHALDNKRYAEGKWTVKDILQHVTDNERIQSYRALRFARKDNSILPGYDETLYGLAAQACSRNIDDLIDEFASVRASTINLFKSFTPDMLMQEGICFDKTVSVLALGFVIVGHQIHHRNVIREKYMPLL